jgi:hypothetical protein
MLPGKNRRGRDTNERFHALLPGILLKLCSVTAARTLCRAGRAGARHCISRGTRAENAATCMSVASSADASERVSHPAVVRNAPTRSASREPKHLDSAEEGYRHLSQPGLVFCRFTVMLVAAEVRFSTDHRCVCQSDNLYAR